MSCERLRSAATPRLKTSTTAAAAALILLCAPLSAQTAPASPPVDTAWKAPLAFRTAGSGVWIASNSQYRTPQNREPAAYGQRYWLGFGGTTMHGCLWGEYGAERPVFWRFFVAWDPVKRQFLVHQESPGGVIGLGYESLETGTADQTFTQPNGASSVSRHVSRSHAPDTLMTQSFDKVGADWRPRRTYTWIRQPTGTPSGC